MGHRVVLVGLLATLCVVPAARASEPPLRPPGAATHLGNELLSNEVTLTRYTRANRRATVFSRPDSSSRRVTKLRFFTEENYTEIYIALESRIVDGRNWIKVRVPMRPNGTTGWVPRWALRELRVTTKRLVVNRRTLRATLYDDGKKIWQSRVGVGGRRTPTPAGNFWVRERMRMPGGAYGPYAFGTSAYSVLSDWPGGGIVGIHGTNAPHLIPGRPSHGCIRVPNRKILQLKRLMTVGTPIRIL